MTLQKGGFSMNTTEISFNGISFIKVYRHFFWVIGNKIIYSCNIEPVKCNLDQAESKDISSEASYLSTYLLYTYRQKAKVDIFSCTCTKNKSCIELPDCKKVPKWIVIKLLWIKITKNYSIKKYEVCGISFSRIDEHFKRSKGVIFGEQGEKIAYIKNPDENNPISLYTAEY